MKIIDIINFAKKLAPFETAESWDNVGLLVGKESTEVSSCLLALDITPEVVTEAHEKGCELIISHHPVIFHPISSLSPDSAEYKLAFYNISALCLHTNLDRAENGVNTALAKALGLKNIELYPDCFLAIGDLEKPCSADDFAQQIKAKLSAPSVRYTDGEVRRVAVSSGGGGESVMLFADFGFNGFVTGEMRHHEYLFAKANGVAAFDAGHFSTEDVVIKPLKEAMSAQFPEIDFVTSKHCTCPYKEA